MLTAIFFFFAIAFWFCRWMSFDFWGIRLGFLYSLFVKTGPIYIELWLDVWAFKHFFFLVIGVIGFVLCFLWVSLINKTCVAILASSWLGWACIFVMAVLNFFFFIFILVFIYILVIGNIINLYLCKLRLLKTCYCLVKLQQYFLYKSSSISYFLYTWKLFFYFSLYKLIVWLEMSTRKYASEYEKLKKEKRKKKDYTPINILMV